MNPQASQPLGPFGSGDPPESGGPLTPDGSLGPEGPLRSAGPLPSLGASGYLRAPDGVELFYRFWEPQSVRAVMIAFHGLAAHGDWYESLAAALLPRGIATLAPDLRGHGMTRWDLGRLPGPDLLVQDARFFLEQARRRFTAVPLYAAGTSLGACLAALVCAAPGAADGGILISPSFSPRYLPWLEKARMSLSLLFGREGGAATPLGRGLMISGDRLRLEWLRKDPLALLWMPARAHWNARTLIRRARAALPAIEAPLLCVQGARDPVTSVPRNRSLFQGRANTRFVLWEEAYHDLALEAEVEYLAGVLADWMRHQGSQHGSPADPADLTERTERTDPTDPIDQKDRTDQKDPTDQPDQTERS